MMKLKSVPLLLLCLITPLQAQVQWVSPNDIPPYQGEKYEDFLNKKYLDRYPSLVKVIDADTFRAFDKYDYAADKKYAYYLGKILIGVDPTSFRVHNSRATANKKYMLDKNHIIYQGEIIPLADPETFDRFSFFQGSTFEYTFDKKHVFINGEVIENAIPNSFIPYKNGHSRDKNHIYYKNQQLKNSDADSFTFIKPASKISTNSFGYAKDKNQVYYYPKVIENADPKTFQVIADDVAKDDQNVYFKELRVEDIADPAGFKVLYKGTFGPTFFKDSQFPYYQYFSSFIKISDADISTFELIAINNTDSYGKDHNFIYAFHEDGYKILTGLDPQKTQFQGPFITDGKILYNSLSQFYTKGGSTNGFAKNRIPSYGFDLVENIDMASFEYLLGNFAMDKENVYQGSGKQLKILGKRSDLKPRLIELSKNSEESDKTKYLVIGEECYNNQGMLRDCSNFQK